MNSFSSRRTVPVSLEYRRGIGRHFEWTVSGLYEGDNAVINRYGPATQIWMIDTPGDWPLRFGLGAGVYYASDNVEDGSEGLAGLVSLTGSWQFHPQYNLRVNWHRVVSDYDRDTDVILVGFGRGF